MPSDQIRKRLRKLKSFTSRRRFSPLTDKMMRGIGRGLTSLRGRGRGLTPLRGVRGRRGTMMAL